VDSVFEQIEALTEENRRSRSPELERKLVGLRHQAGVELCSRASNGAEVIAPDYEALKDDSPLPEIQPDELTAGLVRAAMLSHGAVLIRGLVDAEDSTRLRDEIERAYQTREEGAGADAYYEEFDPPDQQLQRGFVKNSGIWAADSPRLMFEMLDTFDRVGLQRVAREYLGEPPAVTLQKCTLRKALPEESQHARWHQDGAFLGEFGRVRALNVWLSLSHCGDDAPGMDLVPRRLDHIVPSGTDGVRHDWIVSSQKAEEAAAGLPIIRPIFEAGDVLLFDELYLHSTATNASMSNPRYAIECWFFGPSAFPEGLNGRDYIPFAG
jgi:hypothetical protein